MCRETTSNMSAGDGGVSTASTPLMMSLHCVQTGQQPRSDPPVFRSKQCVLTCGTGCQRDTSSGGSVIWAAVTCSWPRCWSPGPRPWSGWRETSRLPPRLRHGSETPSPPAPIWSRGGGREKKPVNIQCIWEVGVETKFGSFNNVRHIKCRGTELFSFLKVL